MCTRYFSAKKETQRQLAAQWMMKQSGLSPVTPQISHDAQESTKVNTSEFAVNASNLYLETTNPSPVIPVTESNSQWIVDSGATAHMIPHHHWLQNFTPAIIPIRLADHKVVYATGIGTVQFIPKVDGKQF